MKEQGTGVRGQGSGRRSGISAATVREFLREFPGSAVLEVAEHLQVQTHKEHDRVKQILHDLVRSGTVMRECQGDFITYRLTDKPGRGSVQAKLWEFACLRFATAKPFTAAEAARLAECDRDNTKRYCRWLCNSGYLAIVSRGRAGAMLYQVVGGKEHEAAPAWNRRAEKRKNSSQGSVVSSQKEIPPAPPLEKGGDSPSPQPSPQGEGVKGHRLEACATSLDAALEDFGRALVDITGSIGRAWEVIREMKGELLALAVEEKGHDEPGEPTKGHH